MEIVLIIVGIALIGVICAVFVNSDNNAQSKVKNNVQTIFNKIVNSGAITPTNIFKPLLENYIFAIDENNKKVVYVSADVNRVFNFDEIINFELLESGSTIFQKSAMRTIGGALVGDVLAGGIGAIIGGLSGGQIERRKVSSIVIKVLLKDIKNPSLEIFIFENYKLPPYSDDAAMPYFYGDASVICDMLSVIVDRKAQDENIKENNENEAISLTEDITRIHKLLQDGIITNEEFSKIKNKLIEK